MVIIKVIGNSVPQFGHVSHHFIVQAGVVAYRVLWIVPTI